MYKVDLLQQLGLDTQSAQQLVPGSQSPQFLASGCLSPEATAVLQVLVCSCLLSLGWLGLPWLPGVQPLSAPRPCRLERDVHTHAELVALLRSPRSLVELCAHTHSGYS